jgi:D-lactate dehydrogenase (cytochrome)
MSGSLTDFLDACRAAIGACFVLTDSPATDPYLTDRRRRHTGRALAVALPASTEEVVAIVRLCNAHRVPIVPQGGNTGLVLGSVPDISGAAIVLSLTRMNRIRKIDALNNTLTAEAGCILQHVQQAASEVQRLFPLSLAAEGTCTIGGNLASNAGGTAVLRYGNARELCLGLEVVTPQGEIWDGLRGLRKDNTGYDLRDLYIGAEGTLGIITAAVLKLFPQPKAQMTALAALRSPQHALRLLSLAQQQCGTALSGFELMSGYCLQLVHRHFPHYALPFSAPHAQYVLLELSDSESAEHASAALEKLMRDALEQQLIEDAAIAASLAQSQALWGLREAIPLAQAAEGQNIKHDVSLPISAIADFVASTDQLLQRAFPGVQPVSFGHLGDGNLHYNVAPPPNESQVSFLSKQAAVNRVVHDNVQHFGGSISAEHGLGALKREEILRYKSSVEMELMRSIKRALDPLNLMNPGKLLQP